MCQPVSDEDPITAGSSAMVTMRCQHGRCEDPLCNAVSNVCVVQNTFPTCISCGDRQAITSRPAKPEDPLQGPGSHPLTHCGQCALLDDGCFLKEAAACLCGEEKYFRRSLCRMCLRNAPCRIDGCNMGGNGETNEDSSLCRVHYNQLAQIRREEKHDVSDCPRCGKSLLFNRKGSKGVLRDMCSNSPCADLCAFRDADDNWCMNKQVKRGYCQVHHTQKSVQEVLEWRARKKDGTFKYKKFQPEEDSFLSDLTSKHTKSYGKGTCVDWKVVVPLFQKKFKNHEQYCEKTEKQMKERNRGLNAKKKM